MSAIGIQSIGTCLLLACLGLESASAQDSHSDIYGDWKISRDLTPEGAITSKSSQQIRAAIGEKASIRPDSFAFNGEHCSRPAYTRSTDDTLQYFDREWRINAATLPLGPKVTIVEVGCSFHVIYPVDRRRLLIADDGIFFEAIRVGKPK